MTFLTQLNAELDNYHLLKHPFYEHLWNCGLLKNTTLQSYADECAQLIAKLSPEEQKRAEFGAVRGAKLLWSFLDQMAELDQAA